MNSIIEEFILGDDLSMLIPKCGLCCSKRVLNVGGARNGKSDSKVEWGKALDVWIT